MLFGRMAGERVYGLKDQHSNALTTNIGVSYIWNRILMLVVLAGLLLAGGLALLYKLIFRKDLIAARLNRS